LDGGSGNDTFIVHQADALARGFRPIGIESIQQ
jgi:hypothetical protein